MKTRTMCATLLAIGSVVAGGSVAGAASAKPCDSGDKLVSAVGHESYDIDSNGSICEHREKSVAPKKRGGSWSTTYYDDRL